MNLMQMNLMNKRGLNKLGIEAQMFQLSVEYPGKGRCGLFVTTHCKSYVCNEINMMYVHN
jgi:hypothetical protein